jgi:hypothetical protein
MLIFAGHRRRPARHRVLVDPPQHPGAGRRRHRAVRRGPSRSAPAATPMRQQLLLMASDTAAAGRVGEGQADAQEAEGVPTAARSCATRWLRRWAGSSGLRRGEHRVPVAPSLRGGLRRGDRHGQRGGDPRAHPREPGRPRVPGRPHLHRRVQPRDDPDGQYADITNGSALMALYQVLRAPRLQGAVVRHLPVVRVPLPRVPLQPLGRVPRRPGPPRPRPLPRRGRGRPRDRRHLDDHRGAVAPDR